jgi:hypothetical protein
VRGGPAQDGLPAPSLPLGFGARSPDGVRRASWSAPRRPPSRRRGASAFRRLEHDFERCCEIDPIRSAPTTWIAARRWRLRAHPRHTRRGRPSPGWPVGVTTLDGHPPSTPASERMRRSPCPGPLLSPVRAQRHVRARERQARSSARRGPSRRTTPGARPRTAAWPQHPSEGAVVDTFARVASQSRTVKRDPTGRISNRTSTSPLRMRTQPSLASKPIVSGSRVPWKP